ncbi:MAG: DNA-binding response regulator [Desulfuromonas sp.]|nr:MAG: DNA-binding response regulator [Desulfuromonas sp.]
MPDKNKILLVDDEETSSRALSVLLSQDGYQIISCTTGEKALSLLESKSYDLILCDLRLPGINGLGVLKRSREITPNTSFIMITGNASTETAVEAMREGAFDYITKPFNFEKLKLQVAKALEKSHLLAENIYLRQQLHGQYRFDRIIGNSMPMQMVFSRMEKVIHTDSTILILGASGTGKELVAKAIHYNSARKQKPFVAINCGAIPADLLESELFGHVKGAFTSAVHDKTGKFELANGGTLFLDEIGNMPLQLQMKLLRVLQEHEFERVGSTKKIKLDVRLISATNIDLLQQIQKGDFREDLYYRLNVIPIKLPPLKERRADIPLLAYFFLKRICQERERPIMAFEADAMAEIQNYDWPGNVREMENLIERTVTLTDGTTIRRTDLPPDIFSSAQETPALTPHITADGIDMPATIAAIEQQMISQALDLSNNVKTRAAELLNINRTTLVEKIKRLNLNTPAK